MITMSHLLNYAVITHSLPHIWDINELSQMQAIHYLPCTVYSFISQYLQQKKKFHQIPSGFVAKPTSPKQEITTDTSDRSERQDCSSQSILLNYAIITVSALE